MWIYLIALAIIFIPIIAIEKSQRHIKYWLIYSWFILTLIEGLRAYSIGKDTAAYVQMFAFQRFGNTEIAYQLLNSFVYKLTSNPTIFLLIVAGLSNGLIIWSIWKLSSNPAVSLFSYIALYYYFNSFNGMRQYIAVGFVLVAYVFLIEKKYIKACIGFTLAILFHNSAIIGLVLIPISISAIRNRGFQKPKPRLSQKISHLLLPFVIFFAFQGAVGFLYDVFLRLFPKYAYYEAMSSGLLRGTDAIQQKVIYTSILILYVLLCEEDEWRLILSFAVSLSFMMSYFKVMNRFLWYFDIFSVFALADIWNSNRVEIRSRGIVNFLMISFLLAFLIYYLSAGVMRVTPYSFAFMT